ncbi:MAG: hypothetical protein R3E12_17620 [Candidatus Eisenbacteria bacterium]
MLDSVSCEESARIGRATGSPFVASFVLIAVLAVLLWGTAGGRSYTALMRNAYR